MKNRHGTIIRIFVFKGERLYMTNVGGDQLLMAANNGQPSMVTDMDESLMNSCTLPTMDEDMQTINDTSGACISNLMLRLTKRFVSVDLEISLSEFILCCSTGRYRCKVDC